MLDFLRNWTKSAQEKRQEALHAYLDNELSPVEKNQFERQLAADADLRAEVEKLRFFKQQLRQMPRRPVPRNFILDPAAYTQRPKREPLVQAYPILRTATAMTAFIFVLVLAINFFPAVGGGFDSAVFDSTASETVMLEEAPRMTAADELLIAEGELVEVTRVVTEEVIIESSSDKAEALALESGIVEEEVQEEAAAEEEAEAPAAAESADAANAAGNSQPVEAPPAAPTVLPTQTPRPTHTPTATPNFEATAVTRLESYSIGDDTEEQSTTIIRNRNPLGRTETIAIIFGTLFLLLILLTWIARRRIKK